jgi:hypothetical protein
VNEAEQALRRAVEMLDELGTDGGTDLPARVYSALVEVAGRRLPGVGSASVTVWDGRRCTTAAATDDAAREADRFQYDIGAGPSVDAVRGRAVSHVPDVQARDDLSALGFGGILSLRLTEGDPRRTGETAAALTLYSDKPHALDEPTVQLARLLAAHARTSIRAADREARAAHLERSRQTTAQIGTAVGILMTTRELGHDEAMELLRTISQRSNVRVSALAAEIIQTRELPRPKTRGPRPRG